MASGLATRCPACGTVFRVVPDQLRVSEGWVRCGRCSDVFNAAESLVDLETGTARRLNFEPPAPPPPPEPEPDPLPPEPEYEENFDFRAVRDPQPYQEPRQQAHGETDRLRHGPQDEPRFDPEPAAESVLPVVDTPESRFAADAADAFETTTAETRPGQTQTPSFVRRAERAQRWRHPRVRLALALVGLLAALGLAAQATVAYRDLVAARSPALKPVLQQACAWLSCTVAAAHAIDSITVESSGLVRVEKSSIYKLSVALRNRAGIELAMPALDLSLTDAQGKLLARRVLRAAELGAPATTLPAGRDVNLQATLQTPFTASEPVPRIAARRSSPLRVAISPATVNHSLRRPTMLTPASPR